MDGKDKNSGVSFPEDNLLSRNLKHKDDEKDSNELDAFGNSVVKNCHMENTKTRILIKETDKKDVRNVKCTTQQKQEEIDLLLQQYATRDEENKWFCNSCGLKFIRSSSALYHLERVHDVEFQGLYKWSCEYCNKTFTNKDSLKQHHYKVHKEQDVDICEGAPQYTYDENRNYICNVCEVKFRKRATLLQHLNNKHGILIKYLYICGICQRIITSRAGLIAHVKCKHVDGKKDKSNEDKSTSNVSSMIHKNMLDISDKSNLYDDCDKQNNSAVCIKVICYPKGVSSQSDAVQDERVLNRVLECKDDDNDCNEQETDDLERDFVEPTRINDNVNKESAIISNNGNEVIKDVEKKSKSRICDDGVFDETQQEELRQCVACGCILSSGDKLLLHIKTVHAEEYTRIKDEFSNYGSTSDSETDDDLLDCNVCEEKFSNLKQYSLHVKLNHKRTSSPNHSASNDSDFFLDTAYYDSTNQCSVTAGDICNSIFNDEYELTSHKNVSHSCNVTAAETKQVELSNMHEKNNSNNSSFDIDLISRRCHLCNIIFPTKNFLSLHMDLKHPSDRKRLKSVKNHVCLICQKKFLSNKCLSDHRRKMHTWKESIALTCRICGSILTSQFTLKSHIETTHKDNNILYEVFFIDDNGKHYTFEEVEKSALMDCEMKSADDKKYLRFKCKLCGKILKGKQSVVFHLNALHADSNIQSNIQCPHCDYKCKVYKYMQFHITTKHPTSELVDDNNIQKYVCDKCGYDTINKRAFISHIHRHKSLYKCTLCDYSTKHQAVMVAHRRKHENKKPFKCEFSGCDYASVMRGQLKIHYMSHDPEKYTKCCDICGFKNVNPYVMNSHRKEHDNGLTYRCNQCSYTTNSKINFRTHSTVHREPKLCVLCNFKTKYNQTMRCHMKTKHEIDVPKRSYLKKRIVINKIFQENK